MASLCLRLMKGSLEEGWVGELGGPGGLGGLDGLQELMGLKRLEDWLALSHLHCDVGPQKPF